MADNRVIGREGKLSWNIPEDLAHFKRLTTGGTIVMGRKTYESIGRPLPNRRNIVLSSQDIAIPGVEVFASIERALDALESDWIDKVFIIGGQKIYEEFLQRKLVDEIVLSRIPGNYDWDASLIHFENDFIEQDSEQFETFRCVRYTKRP